MTDFTVTTPLHDKDMAMDFLTALRSIFGRPRKDDARPEVTASQKEATP